MPFGKHRGRRVADLPDQYLAWLRTIELRPPLAEAVADEWRRRREVHDVELPTLSPMGRMAAEKIVVKGFRVCALKDHPDTGGTGEHMVALGEAKDFLLGVMKGLGA